MSTPLHYRSATEILDLFATRELSPLEYLEALIERAEDVNPAINAWSEDLYDEARTAAIVAGDRYLGKGPAPRALEGLPVATKEKHAIKGRSLTEGSMTKQDDLATENAPVVDRVLDAGGIIHARTTTPEFSIALFTHTPMWGVTRNPWNPDFTPGGSSGGAGAALAAGMTPLATASDIGGSTRGPAGFTGTVGFKAPYGRIAASGPMTMDYYRGDGPMARTVDDAILFANNLIGPDPRDHVSLRPAQLLPTGYRDVAGMRIALTITAGDFVVDPEIEANTRAVAQALTDAGAHVEEVTLPWTREQLRIGVAGHFAHMMAAMADRASAGKLELMSDYAAGFLTIMREITKSQVVPLFTSVEIETTMQRQLAEAMRGFDALICPTAGTTGFPAGDSLLNGHDIAGTHLDLAAEAMLTLPFNIANRCPVLNVPSGHARNGVPTGVQIVGHTYDDPTVFRIGKAIEAARPWAFTEQHQPSFTAVFSG